MKKDFDTFISQLKETNQTLDFFCDFEKINQNVDDIRLSLCMLNSLLGRADIRKGVELIWERDRSVFKIMNILIAVRNNDEKQILTSEGRNIRIGNHFDSIDGIVEFLDQTGLSKMFRENKIKDLTDYVLGIETGLDSNARKNRSGHIMENMVAQIFSSNSIPYRKEISSSEWPQIAQVLGNDRKRFDFVVKTPIKTYLTEVNFYSGGGSKLNEVARAYSEIAPKINSIPQFEFVWITDGIGWKQAKSKLQEAYNIIPRVYNLTSMREFIEQVKDDFMAEN